VGFSPTTAREHVRVARALGSLPLLAPGPAPRRVVLLQGPGADARGAAGDRGDTDGPLKGKAWKGIYALRDDTLMVCDNAPNLDKGRPAAFEARSGSGHILITFKRAKP